MAGRQRVVVITGGGTGMGQAAAWRFADHGDKVWILGRRLNKLEETARGHTGIKPVQADVTDLGSLRSAAEKILAAHKKIDILVNCAGGSAKLATAASLEEQHATWNNIIDLNLTSVFNVIAVLGDHINHGGRIINVTSLAALNGSRQGGATGQAYAAAKSGVHGLTRTLVGRFAPDNITVNCVAPGVIEDTEFFPNKTVPEDIANYYLPKTPLARLGKPEEIAAGIFYLASEEASFITGEILNINGGVQFGR